MGTVHGCSLGCLLSGRVISNWPFAHFTSILSVYFLLYMPYFVRCMLAARYNSTRLVTTHFPRKIQSNGTLLNLDCSEPSSQITVPLIMDSASDCLPIHSVEKKTTRPVTRSGRGESSVDVLSDAWNNVNSADLDDIIHFPLPENYNSSLNHSIYQVMER